MIEDLKQAKKMLDEGQPLLNCIAVITNSRKWFDEHVRKLMDKVPEAKFYISSGMATANGIKVLHVNSVDQVRGLRNWEVMLLDDAHEVADFEKIMVELAIDRAQRQTRESRGEFQ
jgi:hypothetical protein